MAFPQIGLSIEIDTAAIKRHLAASFPEVAILTMEEAVVSDAASWPPIVFTVSANESEFPTLVDFAAFPGESGTEVAIGLALARRFAATLGCRAVSDGSGLGPDSSPYWSIIQDGDRVFLADDRASAFVDGKGGALRVVGEVSVRVGVLDARARLIDMP